jgi:hypothetical protein
MRTKINPLCRIVSLLPLLLLAGAINGSTQQRPTGTLTESTQQRPTGILTESTQQRPTGILEIHHPDQAFYLKIGTFTTRLTSGDTLHFPAGEHQILLFSGNYRDEILNVEIAAGRITRVVSSPAKLRNSVQMARMSYWPVHTQQANILLESDADADLCLGNTCYGSTLSLLLPRGTYMAESRGPNGRINQKRIQVTESRLFYADMSHRKTREQLVRSAWIPGYAQYHRGETIKSVSLGVTFATAGFMVGRQILQHRSELNQYRNYQDAYASVNRPEASIVWSNRLTAQQDRVNAAAQWVGIYAAATSLIYVFNVIDGRRPGKLGYRTAPVQLQPFAEVSPFGSVPVGGLSLHITLK